MILFLVLVVVLLVGLTTAAVMGKISGFMADPTSSQSFVGVPADAVLSDDYLAELHFDQALRGYRMDQVDEVIDALSARLRQLESELSLGAATGASSSAVGDSPDAGSASWSGAGDSPRAGGASSSPAGDSPYIGRRPDAPGGSDVVGEPGE